MACVPKRNGQIERRMFPQPQGARKRNVADSNEYLSSAFWRVSSGVAGYEERRKRKLDLHQSWLSVRQ